MIIYIIIIGCLIALSMIILMWDKEAMFFPLMISIVALSIFIGIYVKNNFNEIIGLLVSFFGILIATLLTIRKIYKIRK